VSGIINGQNKKTKTQIGKRRFPPKVSEKKVQTPRSPESGVFRRRVGQEGTISSRKKVGERNDTGLRLFATIKKTGLQMSSPKKQTQKKKKEEVGKKSKRRKRK